MGRLRLTLFLCLFAAFEPAQAQTPPPGFTGALARGSAAEDQVARFYQERGFRPLWTGIDAGQRRDLFLAAIATAQDQGLPAARYDAAALTAQMRAVVDQQGLAALEIAFTRAFLRYAHDLRSGVLRPSRVDPTIVREVSRRDPQAELAAFEADPAGFLRALPPQDPEYARLVRVAARLAQTDWGPEVPAGTLRPGSGGAALIALRDRLGAMGYLHRSVTAVYDESIRDAVARFQQDHGLQADGVAGAATLREINVPASARLRSVLVALERHRWMNADRGARHIWVNLADATTQIVDGGEVTFQTRSVIGREAPDQRTPEFSDMMDHMVVNPSWHVPRSIVTREYLPKLQQNRNAVSHIKLIDANGREVDRSRVNFGAYSASSFPFAMRQPPSETNALGLVKFMFPNKWNIYLHDTPSKSLFSETARAFSHGCVRLADPFDFAYALLAPQTGDAQAEFQRILATGKETRVRLTPAVPVHLVYFTAQAPAKGMMRYRPDVYGRDAALWSALEAAGVAMRAVQG